MGVRGQVGRHPRDRALGAGPPQTDHPQRQRRDRRLSRAARAQPHARLAQRAARRRDRRVRRARQAELPGLAAAHPPARRDRGPPPRSRAPGHVRDLRPAVARRPLADGAAVRRAPRAPRGARSSTASTGACRAPRRRGVRAARRHARAGARGRRRQAARLALRARPARRQLAEGQALPSPGAGDRRLDGGRGSAHRARSARCCSATTTRTARCGTPARSAPASTTPSSTASPKLLEPLARERLRSRPPAGEGRPLRRARLVCEVEFGEWTRDGRLRHPRYKGLREDKPAAEVVREGVAPRLPTRRLRRPRQRPAACGAASRSTSRATR